MKKLNIVFLDRATVDRADLDFSRLDTLLQSSIAKLAYYDYTSPAELEARLEHADIVISNKVVLNAAALAHSGRLKLVCIAATGTNIVDLEQAQNLGIAVCNVRGYATPSVVQHVFSLLLALNVRLREHSEAVDQGLWQKQQCFCWLDYPFSEIAGKKLGIVGFGELGRAVAALAAAFGLKVLVSIRPGSIANDKTEVGRVAFDKLIAEVDFLSLHCPLAENTQHLINANTLALMKPGLVLINTARGGLIDEEALAAALRQGTIRAAGLDVLSLEPPENSNPLLQLKLPNLIITPHIAWAAIESRQRLFDQLVDNIQGFIDGKLPNQVA